MRKEKVWENIITELKAELDEKAISTWLDSVSLKSIDHDSLVIETPNKFVSDWVSKHYRDKILKAARQVVGPKVSLLFETNPKAEQGSPSEQAKKSSAKPEKPSRELCPGLNPNYRFENFVVGPSNQFAHAACLAVSEKQSRNYNPLFIYGGVGLGKTHLLNAVGNDIHNRKSKLRIICIQAESFMNEMIQAIRQEKMDLFRKHYRRECDVLLMDDIEILAGKERTQEEFFYTFNNLYAAGKTIIITSDKFPKEMNTLEERLRSRFESGIIVDIQPPEFETRLAILKRKAEKDGTKLPNEVAVFLAERIRSNIRKLEGSLIRLSAISSLSGSPISIDLAEEVIKAIMDDIDSVLSPDTVMKAVASYFKVKVSDLKSPKRNRKYALPRQVAMYLCRELAKMSFPEIGQAFGGRDHSTVIHSCKKIGIEKNTDPELRKQIDLLSRNLKVDDH